MPAKDKGKMKTLKRILVQLTVGANIMAAFMLLLCGLSSMLNPADYPHAALFCLGFPILWGINLFFVLLWAVFYIRNIWIPFAGMLFSVSYIYDYCPLNWPEAHPEGSLKMITYNAASFMKVTKDSLGRYPLFDYLTASDADIICLQEVIFGGGITREYADGLMASSGYHTVHLGDGVTERQYFYTRLPILSVERVAYQSSSNGSVAAKLLYGQDTVLLVNNHFESYKLTPEDKQNYKEIIKSPEQEDVESKSKELVRKMEKASRQRGPQVDSVLRYIDLSGVRSVIACGDFNEPPVSYACHRLSSRLSSAFRQSGNGIGMSYNQSGFYFRIDHVFVSDDWQSYETHVDKTASWSDHYPLITYLKKRKI